MNTIELKSVIEVLDFNELTENEIKVVNASKSAIELSHSPYSQFKVGCAIELESGEIIKGANQENAAYPICLCAEGSTLASVVTQYPGKSIKNVSIFVPIENPASPCGLCRQSFKEYETRMKKKFLFYLVSNSSVYRFQGIDTILPLAFSSEDLANK